MYNIFAENNSTKLMERKANKKCTKKIQKDAVHKFVKSL